MVRLWTTVLIGMMVAVSFGERLGLPSIYWRVRSETWSVFDPADGRDTDYTFVASLLRVGINGYSGRDNDWQLELAQVTLLGLPQKAAGGLGAVYRRFNGGREGSLFVKQAFLRRWGIVGEDSSLRIGRFSFSEGLERMPKDPTLRWLRQARIRERLLGPFGFTHVQRSYDGIHLQVDRPQGTLTVAAVRPTRGAFDLKGNDQLSDITLFYGSWVFNPSKGSDARLFLLHYRDERDVVKVDNRSLDVRQGDKNPITITMVGAHYLQAWKTGDGNRMDLLLWGGWQFGNWGQLDHDATAVALEVGHQWTKVQGQPWIRVGYFASDGDSDPNDMKHETFFQFLPTARIYARTPLFNLMNNRDLFVQLIWQPIKNLSLRLDWHRLWLSDANDLWYTGGGAFNNTAFGYGGRPSGGRTRLMELIDLSATYRLGEMHTLTLYIGRAVGSDVVRSNFPGGSNATYLYLEWVGRW